MPKNGAFAIILNKENKVLLALRDDMPLWNLIGGQVEEGESFEETLIREVKEETDLDAEIIRQTGEYIKQQNGIITKAYLCKAISEDMKILDEGILLKFFPIDKLPKNMSEKQRMRIADAIKNPNKIIKREEETSTKNSLDILKSLKLEEISDLEFWKNHPKVLEKKKAGILKYYPE